jgi:DnaK suppressor protein
MPAKKKVTAKKKVAKKAAKKPTVSRKKAAKKAAKKAPAKKKAKKKTITKKKVAKKKATKKAPAKKKAKKKTITKKKVAKKKAAKKSAKKTISNKKTTGNKNKKAMGKVTNIKKIPTQKSQKRKSAAKKKITPYKKKRKNEDYMGPKQTEHFRYILLAWKSELMQEVDRTVHHMQDDATNFPDPNDRASQEEEFALELRTRDRERKLISKIDESITMLDSADYGYCEICGIEIGIHRLEARPTATQCIDCKTLDEIKEHHLG